MYILRPTVLIISVLLLSACSSESNPVKYVPPVDEENIDPDAIKTPTPTSSPESEPIAAAAASREEADALFRQQSAGVESVDCNVVDTGWICANFDNPQVNDITVGFLPLEAVVIDQPSPVKITNAQLLEKMRGKVSSPQSGYFEFWYLFYTGRDTYHLAIEDYKVAYGDPTCHHVRKNIRFIENGDYKWFLETPIYIDLDGGGFIEYDRISINPDTLFVEFGTSNYYDGWGGQFGNENMDVFYDNIRTFDTPLLKEFDNPCEWSTW